MRRRTRAELLHVLMLPDFERADRIGEFWGYPESRTFAELPDRLRGGSDTPGGAGWDAAGVQRLGGTMDWRLYADRSRFKEVPTQRLFVLQGAIRRRHGEVYGDNWHVFLETSDFDVAWASVPRPGIVVTEDEIRNDPVLLPHFEEWRSGDDAAHRRFMETVLAWTEDEDDPN